MLEKPARMSGWMQLSVPPASTASACPCWISSEASPIACDPVALARDLATFRGAGYEPGPVAGLDLFPNSHHLEAVTTLSRAGAPR